MKKTTSFALFMLFLMSFALILKAQNNVSSPIPTIKVTEIMYNNQDTMSNGYDSLEFIEAYNYGTTPVNMSGFMISGGIGFTFPPNIILPAGAYGVVARHDTTIMNYFGINCLEWTTNNLNNNGEGIILSDSLGVLIDSVHYHSTIASGWPNLGDGHGYSIELCNVSLENDSGSSWGASGHAPIVYHGLQIYASPGFANSCLITDVNQISAKNTDFNISPNPTDGLFEIVTGWNNEPKDVTVYNVLGEKIYTSGITGNYAKCDLSFAQKGLYLVQITNKVSGKSQIKKVYVK